MVVSQDQNKYKLELMTQKKYMYKLCPKDILINKVRRTHPPQLFLRKELMALQSQRTSDHHGIHHQLYIFYSFYKMVLN